jgi:hypothetical protein
MPGLCVTGIAGIKPRYRFGVWRIGRQPHLSSDRYVLSSGNELT